METERKQKAKARARKIQEWQEEEENVNNEGVRRRRRKQGSRNRTDKNGSEDEAEESGKSSGSDCNPLSQTDKNIEATSSNKIETSDEKPSSEQAAHSITAEKEASTETAKKATSSTNHIPSDDENVEPTDDDVCTICFGTKAEDADLISPCKCKGTQRFVHRKCLTMWQASLMKRWNVNSLYKAKYCAVCNASYSVTPPGARVIAIIEVVRSSFLLCFALSVAPFFSFTVAGCLFGGAATYVIFRAPMLSLSMLFMVSYMLVYVGLRPAITTNNGRLRIAFTRHGAAVEGIDAGIFLVAKAPHGGIFGRSVILVIEHGVEGTYGLILNHHYVALPEDSREQLRIGGPVPDQRVYLTKTAVDGARRAAGLDVFVGHNEPPDDVDYVSFEGSSRWAVGQLDGEIRAKSWSWIPKHVVDVHEALKLGAEGKDRLWQFCAENEHLKEFVER